jgi:hypothetical protein
MLFGHFISMEEYTYNKKKSKWQSFAGFMRTFLTMANEDFNEMDHKLIRIGMGITMFVVMALFWLFFLKNIVPIRF